MKLCLSLIVSLVSVSAFAGTVHLRSAEGQTIEITSSTRPVNGNVTVAAEVTVVVGTSQYPATEKVSAVLVTNCPGGINASQTIVLLPAGAHNSTSGRSFFGNYTPAAIPAVTRQGSCSQQIAVVKDGQWQTDPINGTHNFNYSIGQ